MVLCDGDRVLVVVWQFEDVGVTDHRGFVVDGVEEREARVPVADGVGDIGEFVGVVVHLVHLAEQEEDEHASGGRVLEFRFYFGIDVFWHGD